MEAFGIMGMSMGSMAFIFALCALSRISELEKKVAELTNNKDEQSC